MIDMLNDFVLAGAPLEVPRTREILSRLRRRLDEARQAGVPVIDACDAHRPDDREFEGMGWLPPTRWPEPPVPRWATSWRRRSVSRGC